MALLLFDIDGTLMRPRDIGRRAFNAALLALYGRLPEAPPFPYDGMLDTEIARRTLVQMGLQPTRPEVTRLLEAYVSRLPEEAPSDRTSHLCPGFPTSLDRAAAEGHRLGLLTGNVRAGAQAKLGFVGLARYFSIGAGTGDLLGAFGEDASERWGLVPRAMERCSEAFGAPFARTSVWLIGDSKRDVEAARRAGVKCAAVATGHTEAEALLAMEPDFFLADFSDPEPFFAALRDEAAT
jgi:phosphoglycolate phosphatase